MSRKSQQPKPLSDFQVKFVERAMAYIRSHFRESPTLHEIAAVMGYSPFHLHRLFRQHYRKTMKRVLTELQIEEAKRLLLKGWPASRIAEEVGLAHQSHFTNRFQQFVGLTPMRWLRQQQAAPAADETADGTPAVNNPAEGATAAA